MGHTFLKMIQSVLSQITPFLPRGKTMVRWIILLLITDQIRIEKSWIYFEISELLKYKMTLSIQVP